MQSLARDPASTQTFKVLGSSDLATFGSSAFIGLGAILRVVAPAQFACNAAGLWIGELRVRAQRGRRQRGLAPVRADHRPPSRCCRPRIRPRTCTSTRTRSRIRAQCQAGNEGYTKPGRCIGNPGRRRTSSRTRRRRPACWPRARTRGWCHEPATTPAQTRPPAAARMHPLIAAVARDLRDRVRHLLRVQRRAPVRPPLHVCTRSSTTRVNVRSGDPVRIAGIDVGEVRAPARTGRHDQDRVLDADATDSRSTPTRRSRSATACSSRAATTSPLSGQPERADRERRARRSRSRTSSAPVQFFKLLSTFDADTRATSLDNILDTLQRRASARSPGQPMPDERRRGLKWRCPQLTPLLKDTSPGSRRR